MLIMEKGETRKQETRIPNRAIYFLFSRKSKNLTVTMFRRDDLLKGPSINAVPL